MDAFTYYLILSISIIVTAFFAIGMRLAYKQGLAQGRLEASIKHTELVVKQLAASQAQQGERYYRAGYNASQAVGERVYMASQAQGEEDLIKLYKKVKEQTEASQAQPPEGEA